MVVWQSCQLEKSYKTMAVMQIHNITTGMVLWVDPKFIVH